MSARRKSNAYPNLYAHDVMFDGVMRLRRNPANKRFGDKDVWTLQSTWNDLDEIPAAYELLRKEECKLAQTHEFAWDSEFGYLSPIPEHCGTGLEVETEFHLEGLFLIGDLPAVLAGTEAIRFHNASVTQDEIQRAAHLFKVANQARLGLDEKEIVARATALFRAIVEQELSARRALVEDMPRVLEDSISRALAILRSARLLSPGEYLDLLSPIRLATTMGFLDGITTQECITMMDNTMSTPDILPAADTPDYQSQRDRRDAMMADAANYRFSRVQLSKLAIEYLY